MALVVLVVLALLGGCGQGGSALGVTTDDGATDGGATDGAQASDAAIHGPFAKQVVSFSAGKGGGFGQDKLPGVVLGGPVGGGANSGSLDVVSLGCGGSIVLSFGERTLIDKPGPDLLVFENPFPGWTETGRVAVSKDGEHWTEWPCDPTDKEAGFPGCAGVSPVLANSTTDPGPIDPDTAGGDAFDLATIGVKSARYVRITDTGHNACDAPSAGFDLDAVALIHSAP
ncbi:MAG: cell surface protein [Myxococcales bacterium]|nr:cell surface protein [Myxococcales bacterium]